VPLLAVTATMWHERRAETRAALLHAVPSVVFLVFAAFLAVYALAWVCAHAPRRAAVAALLLISAHMVFWRIVLSSDFINSRL
jgi:uncharacterized iron-regulated membrane protein